MEKKLIDLEKLEKVIVDIDNSKQCENCILDDVCYGNKYYLLNDRDNAIIKEIFKSCEYDGKAYKLKYGMKIEENEIV